ncbi:MAG: hypothetical protein JST30_17045 [Armatimonadetes bacterium]|nr:hypothetical protein [Armatimonadota bacterium]
MAYVNIEDFTVGSFTVDATHGYSKGQTGLDTDHSVFGKRGWFIGGIGNPENATLTLDVRDHEQKLSTTSDLLTYDMRLGLGVSGNVLIDLSRETSVLVDLYTDPPQHFADQWSMLITDVNGVDTSNDGWLLRPGGIRFDIDSFSRQIDWSRVRSIEFTENMNHSTNPQVYSVTHIYAVPEPSLACLGALLPVLLRRRTGSASRP